MNSLSTLPFRLSYRTGRNDLVRDFLNPGLEAAIRYRRAAGYFTSAGLALAARGVANLASRGGTMQLVVSPYLEPDDVQGVAGCSGSSGGGSARDGRLWFSGSGR